MRLFIEPNDILMFRDGKPFSGGDDHFARGTFPPQPSTVYGALRSHILSIARTEYDKFASDYDSIPEHVKKEVGTPAENGCLTIRQFAVAKKEDGCIQQYFPMPRDIAKEKGKENDSLYVLKPDDKLHGKIMTDLPAGLQHVWFPSENALESVTGFLSQAEMSVYLSGRTPDKWTENKRLYETEERTGVRKNRTKRSVETGGLYSVEYYRLNVNVGFTVEVEGTQLLPPESGILRLGGDNRTAFYTKAAWNGIPAEVIKKKISETGRFKIVLTTPAIFTNGWIPGGIDSNTRNGFLNGLEVKLISACIGKPIGIGGFDLVKGRPKDMKKAVPAGSVYYFELNGSSVDELFNGIWLKSISDEKVREGFGLSLIGGY
ncbi:MAG: type III-B CRISPR module-associated protein Cmr3 [Nitrospirae bacterium]|nr:type III-B CRISPR module-associated protein Cmr3 [Nitrospirota bacterium]